MDAHPLPASKTSVALEAVGLSARRSLASCLALVLIGMGLVLAEPGDATGRWGASSASQSLDVAPWRSVVAAVEPGRLAVDANGLVLTSDGHHVVTYDRDGVYRGRLDVGGAVRALFAVGAWWFVAVGVDSGSTAHTLHQIDAGSRIITTSHALSGATFSAAPASGDHVVFSEAGGGLGRLQISSGVIHRWANGATFAAPFVVPGGGRLVVDRLDGVERRQYELNVTPPALSAAVSRTDSLAGVSGDGGHAYATCCLVGVTAHPLPLGSGAGVAITNSIYEPRIGSTAANGGWDVLFGFQLSVGGYVAFHRPGADHSERAHIATPVGPSGTASVYRNVAWSADGTWFAAHVTEPDNSSTLRFVAAPSSPAPPPLRSGAAGEYHAIAPVRALDTRTGVGTGGQTTPLGGATAIDVRVLGVGPVPLGDVIAVAVNVTVVAPSEATYVAVYPAGGNQPLVSTVNAPPGATVPNLAVVAVGTGGAIRVFNAAGAAHVLIDIAGYLSGSAGAPGGRFHTVSPTRVLDTRLEVPLGPQETRALAVRNVAGVPTGARSVALKVTAVAPTEATYLSVFPSDTALPATSNVNPQAGRTAASLVFSGIGGDGAVALYNAAGRSDVVVDVLGYWDDERSTEAGRYIPLPAPVRQIDSRDPALEGLGLRAPIGPGGIRGFARTGGTQREPWVAAPPLGQAVLFNLTATNPTEGGYLTAYPGSLGNQPPWVSTVNFAAGETAASLSIAGYGADGVVNVFNPAGSTDFIVDIAGFFTGPV